VTNVFRQPIGPIFRSQAVQYGTGRLSLLALISIPEEPRPHSHHDRNLKSGFITGV